MSQFSVGAKPSRHEGDLVRWPYPKWPAGKELPELNEDGEPFNPHKDTYPHLLLVPFGPLPLMPVHLSWLQRMTEAWGFEDVSETLRHVVFVANSEPNNNKRLIFRIKRCLHCHVGARADQHKKVTPDGETKLYKFQLDWLRTVTSKCEIKSVDKTVRILCDYYMSRIKAADIEAAKATSKATTGGGEVAEGGEVKTGAQVEEEVFTMNRDHDSRVKVARLKVAGLATEEDQDKAVQILSDDIQALPSACTPDETLAAIRKCQVGRGSASFAEANLETPEETKKRREKEEELENT
eukprot:CAMPEP_0182468872 /NCGR_PEP_ID=MMETSP1319-20130603/16165_1 /TAXON_ID=172717 /ORGANISM="Bolidomonas pacifica, Strain RCC208" /LENGTH=294 /DNA_ID=CAMNT_0024669119 /DNA_START=98 /DNA_END=979 /DNA_ORIENTATION=-